MKIKKDIKISKEVEDKIKENGTIYSRMVDDFFKSLVKNNPKIFFEYGKVTKKIVLKDFKKMISVTKNQNELSKLYHYIEKIENEKVKEYVLKSYNAQNYFLSKSKKWNQ